jgi:putative redox protein
MTTDLPRLSGGKDTAAQPVELLLAALIGCKSATAVFVSRQMKFPLLSVEFNLKAERDPQGALYKLGQPQPVTAQVQRVWGTATVKLLPDSQPESEERLRILHQNVDLRCPVVAMMHNSGIQFDVKWSISAN